MIVATLAVLVRQSGQGLGFADEGTYMLAARYPEEVKQNVSSIFRFTGYLFQIAGHDPTLFRAFGIGLVALSSVVLCWGFEAALKNHYGTNSGTFAGPYLSASFILIGSLLHYQFSYTTPSYYTFTAISVNLLVGLLILGLSQRETGRRIGYLSGLGFGFCFGITVFAKFTTAFALAVPSAIVVAFWPGLQNRLLFAGSLASGVAIWLALSFTLEQPPTEALSMFLEGWRLYQTLGDYDPLSKLLAYPRDLGILSYTAVYPYWPSFALLGLGTLVLLAQARRASGVSVIAWQALAWLTLSTAILISLDDAIFVDVPDRLFSQPIEGRTRDYIGLQLGWIILLGTQLVAIGKIRCFRDLRIFLLLLILISAPVAGLAGTSNPAYNVVQFYAAPWFAAILLLLRLLSIERNSLHILGIFVCLFIAAYASNHTIQGSLSQPAQIKPRRMADQIHPTEVGDPKSTLYLDAETKKIIDDLRAMAEANGFKPGGDMIGFVEIAGLIYGLGAKSPGTPAYPCCSGNRNQYSKIAMTFTTRDRLKGAFLLLDMSFYDDVTDILASVGITFPDDYVLVFKTEGLGRQFELYRPR